MIGSCKEKRPIANRKNTKISVDIAKEGEERRAEQSRVLDLWGCFGKRETVVVRASGKQKSRDNVGGNNSSLKRPDSGGTTRIVRARFEGD